VHDRESKPLAARRSSAVMSRRAGTIASGLLVSLGSLLAAAALVLLAEVSVRVLLPAPCARVRQEADKVAAARRYLTPCFGRERRDGEDYLVASATSGGDTPSTPVRRRRSAGLARIAVVGESSADLLAKHLAKLRVEPGCEQFEVLNCAQPGSALEHVERRFDEVLGYEPDAVVLLFGHNIFFQFDLDERRLRLHGLRAQSCLLSQLAGEPPPPDAPPLDSRLDALEQFLRRAAAKARAGEVALAVATMPANLWLPPGAGLRDEEEPRLLEARFLAARGHDADAIRLLEGLAAEGDFALWHYQLGVQLARAGDERRAYRELHRALDGDGLRLRAPGRVNDLLRRVAAEEKLLLRDTERALESRAPRGLPGWDSFSDNCHLLPEALDREAAAILSLLGDAGLPAGACDARPSEASDKGLRDVLAGVFDLAATWPPDVALAWYHGLALAVENWIDREPDAAERDVRTFLDGASFAAAPEGARMRLLVAVAEGYERAGRRERALALNEQARAAGGAEPWVQKGLFHLRGDEPEAAREAFERALAIGGERADAQSFLRWLAEKQ
jgi:tetratricopeptide (TPR) repeat protein